MGWTEARARLAAWRASAAVLLGISIGTHLASDADAARRQQRKAAAPIAAVIVPPIPAGAVVVKAGSVEIVISDIGKGPAAGTGASSFLTVDVRETSGKRSPEITLTFEALGADLILPGTAIEKWDKSTAAQTLRLVIGSRANRQIPVELRHRGGVRNSSGRLEAQLAVSARLGRKELPAGEGRFAIALADCASDYHASLAEIRARQSAILDTAVVSSAAAKKVLVGGWLFPPRPDTVQGARRTCRAQVMAFDTDAGRPRRVCRSYQSKARQAAIGSEERRARFDADEAKLIDLANAFVASRSAALAFARDGKLQWISNRIIADLKLYTSQPMHPALCTGVDVMLDYFTGNAKSLRAGISGMASSSRNAATLASLRLEELNAMLEPDAVSATVTAESSIAVVASAAAAVPAGAPRTSLQRMASEVARLTIGEEAGREIAGAADVFEALRRLRTLAPDDPLDADLEPLAETRYDILSLIETAAYLDAGNANYSRVHEAIFGTMAKIRDAHTRACVCDGSAPSAVLQGR